MIQFEKSTSGFGDYKIPNSRSFEQQILIEKVKSVVKIALFLIAIGASIYLTTLFPPAAILFVGAALVCTKFVLDLLRILNQTPPVDYLFDPIKTKKVIPPHVLDSKGRYSAILPKDSVESFEWKCKLVQHAEKSIVFSGCYAGGEAFDRFLECIEKRMEEKPELKVSILSSVFFHTPKNKEKVAQLQEKYPDRFLNIVHQEVILYQCPKGRGLLTSNHTKALVIDGGAYFVVGGSGVVSLFTSHSGLESPPAVSENHYGLAAPFFPEAYRDMDFVFHSPTPHGLGARLHIEMSKLVEIYRYREKPIRSAQQELPDPTQTHIPEFDDAKAKELSMAFFPTGPEQSDNAFEKALIQQINEAKESIVIAHMYFTPSRQILDALIRAVHRGLLVTVITNKADKQNPYMNKGFVERSRYFCKQLLEGRPNSHVKIYQYDVPNTTYHKKVVVIDSKSVLTGSANLGTKSLENHDYEIDFFIESPALAIQILKILQDDLQVSTLLSDEEAAHASPTTAVSSFVLGVLKTVV